MTEILDHYTADNLDDEKVDKRRETALDLMRVYLNGVGKRALLNAEEEVELAKRIEAGVYADRLLERTGPETELEQKKGFEKRQRMTESRRNDYEFLARDGEIAKRHLLESNLRLVVSIAKRYQGRGLDLLDIVQDGNLGLVRAVEKFDYQKGNKFSTYATWWIKQAVLRGIADKSRNIRLPVHKVELINKINKAKREMSQLLERDPTLEELSEETAIEIDKILELLDMADDTVSLDMPVGESEEGTSLGYFIQDSVGVSAEGEVMRRAAHEDIYEMLESILTKQEALVTSLRYGLYDDTPKSLEQIAVELVKIEYDNGGTASKLSRERIRTIANGAMVKIRNSDKGQALREYLS